MLLWLISIGGALHAVSRVVLVAELPACFPPVLKMLVRLERVAFEARRGCLSKEVKKSRWKIGVLAGMLASVGAHLTWSTCAQHETEIGGLGACWGCTVSTEPIEPWPGTWQAQTHLVCLTEERTCEVCVLVSFPCALCVYLSPPSPTHNWLSAV